MQQLGGIDSLFLSMDSNRHPMHLASLMLVDPSAAPDGFSFDKVRQLYEARLHLVPPLRRRLVYVPGNLDHPYWIEDPDFDLEYHLRHRALPAPGSKTQLLELVRHLFARPLDRSRPLWEYYQIEGLEDGRIALLVKIHHACIDGVSGAEILANFLDLTPKMRKVRAAKQPWEPETPPNPLDLVSRTVGNYMTKPLRSLEILPRTVATAFNLSAMAFGTGIARPNAPFEAPRSIFNKSVTPHRAAAFPTLSLDHAKAVKNAFGVTVNDVVMAICGTALRRYCLDKEALPEQSLLAIVPVSVRPEDDKAQANNQISFMFCPLATHLDDPMERLQAIKQANDLGKAGQRMVGADLLQDWTQFTTPAVLARATQAISLLSSQQSLRPMFNVVISNVPGPRFPLYWAGARVESLHPIPVTIDGAGLNLTVVSYEDRMHFGIVADRGTVPDVEVIADYLETAMAEYVELAAAQGQAA